MLTALLLTLLPQDPAYYTATEVVQAIDAVVTAYPAIAVRVDLSALPGAAPTHGGRHIYALKLSDAPSADEDEPAIVLAAQHHARELATVPVVIGAMQRIAAGYGVDPDLTLAVDEHELWFVPCVNPDGVEHVWSTDPAWRKNRRNNGNGSFGVDLNRNYPTNWGLCGASTSTSNSSYRGPTAASEPEVRTMRALIAAVRPEVYLDFHNYGRQVLFSYAPCGDWTQPVADLIDAYVDDLRTAMTYGTREPSASGEAPEDHWHSGGALSFVVETGTSFQPSYTTALTEEARVWPGIARMLAAWRPALRGHVRSIHLGAPVEAAITIAPSPYLEGEVTKSRARDGRYGMWLPLGTWQVTWSAPGFRSATRSVTVAALDQPQAIDVDLVPDWADATLTKNGTDRLGTTTALLYASPGDAGALHWIALSGGTSGIPIGARTIPLTADGLFFASATAPGLIDGNVGVLDGTEHATALFHVPDLAFLIGLQLYAAGITIEAGYPLSAKKWSDAVAITIAP